MADRDAAARPLRTGAESRRVSRRAWLSGAPVLLLPSAARATSVLSAADFGLRGGAAEDGSGHDDRRALQAFFDALAPGSYAEAVIPPGRYAVSGPLTLSSPSLRRLVLHAAGAELVFTTPAPERGRAYVKVATPNLGGESLRVEGLAARLARPAVRTANSDMVRLHGFREYHVEGIEIGSSDNMGLTIGRGDPKGGRVTPDSIVVQRCRIGGRREARPHSHGSIGDTGIWIVTPGVQTTVTDCSVRETGDDGIYIGHSASRRIQGVLIHGNTIERAGARGIAFSVPHAVVSDNRIDTTNVAGIACERMDGNDASGARITGNQILRAGQLEAGSIGAAMIPKVHGHGVFIYQPGGDIHLRDNVIDESRSAGVCMLSHADGNFTGLQVVGGSFRRIGSVPPGRARLSAAAVIARGGAADRSCHQIEVRDVDVLDTAVPLLAWESTADVDDWGVSLIDVRVSGSELPAERALVELRRRRRGRPRAVSVEVTVSGDHVPRSIEPARGPLAQGARVRIRRR